MYRAHPHKDLLARLLQIGRQRIAADELPTDASRAGRIELIDLSWA